ncbi:hypothetical protein H2203_000560 [Taxawa tesnikishii (nom. ined.)]|nr:hypothetical protein H2203_000560 [Dothideales sp. JES 119]
MRAYLTQLVELRLIEPPVLAEKFLTQYEHARFSGRPLLELQFRALMASFADLLTSIAELPPDLQSEHAVAEAISSNSISQTSSFRRAPSTRSEAATSVSSNDSAIRHRSATPAPASDAEPGNAGLGHQDESTAGRFLLAVFKVAQQLVWFLAQFA